MENERHNCENPFFLTTTPPPSFNDPPPTSVSRNQGEEEGEEEEGYHSRDMKDAKETTNATDAALNASDETNQSRTTGSSQPAAVVPQAAQAQAESEAAEAQAAHAESETAQAQAQAQAAKPLTNHPTTSTTTAAAKAAGTNTTTVILNTTTTNNNNNTATTAPSLVALPGTHKAPPLPIPTTKKRKFHRTVPVTQLLSDHAMIQKTVHHVFGLLETYGPLTVGQLEYNLPPIVGERVNSQSIHDIVQVLLCMGLIQRVRDPPPHPTTNTANGTAPPAAKPTRYCVNRGIPRADVILPHQILDQIALANAEIERSAQRRKRLKHALLQNKTSTRELLREMAIEYPEIVQDPVYVTALKSFHIDLTVIDRERRLRQQQKALRGKVPDSKTNIKPTSTSSSKIIMDGNTATGAASASASTGSTASTNRPAKS